MLFSTNVSQEIQHASDLDSIKAELNNIKLDEPLAVKEILNLCLPYIYNKILLQSKLYTKSNYELYNYIEATFSSHTNKILTSFLSKKRNNNFSNYYMRSINKLISLFNSSNAKNKKHFCCPICLKENNSRDIIKCSNGIFTCDVCLNKVISLYDQLKTVKSEADKFIINSDINKYSIFANHSATGVRCPTCNGWIPNSGITGQTILCPYSHCNFLGKINEFKPGHHPQSSSSVENLTSHCDLYSSKSTIDDVISLKNEYKSKYNLIMDLLLRAKELLIYRTSATSTILQKEAMLDAFIKFLKLNPYDMIKYLFNGSRDNIQCKLFQLYVSIIQERLPFSYTIDNKKISITDLTDSNLNLFLGESAFEAEIKNELIPNLTKEMYVGSKKLINYGPCFIGKLIDITDVSNSKSLLDKVTNYTFNRINIKAEDGTKVLVEHFRIPSHWEMGSMVFLQRVRKQLVDKIKHEQMAS